MNILFITAGSDDSSTFTNQEDYIDLLAESFGKRDINTYVISPRLDFSDKSNAKPIFEYDQIFEGYEIKNKVYLKECDGFKKYLIDISTRPDKRSLAKTGKINMIYNISVYNFILKYCTDIFAICTFGIPTALLQVYMRYGKYRPFFKKIRTVHLINTLNENSILDNELLKFLPQKNETINIMRLGGSFDLNRAAIICSDRVVVGSVSYSADLKSEAKEARYCHTVRQFGFKLKGIEKGLESKLLNKKNEIIKHPYDCNDIKNKTENKLYLQKLLNMKVSEDIPLMVSFCQTKHDLEYSLVTSAAKTVLNAHTQLIICINNSETDWDLRETDNDNLRIIYTNDTALKTQILCASDIYIYCPPVSPDGCDVAFSCKCGTVPIVYSTGGAKDVIKYYDRANGTGNGFTFNTYNSHDMLYTIWDCLSMFRNEKNHWKNIVKNAINCDFSIDKNAEKLLEFIL